MQQPLLSGVLLSIEDEGNYSPNQGVYEGVYYLFLSFQRFFGSRVYANLIFTSEHTECYHLNRTSATKHFRITLQD